MALQLLITLGPGESESVRWLALLLTYFAHALLWTLTSALLLRMTKLSARRANTVWKLTLLGPLATTILSAGPPWGALWSWHETLPEVMEKVTLASAAKPPFTLAAVASVPHEESSLAWLALLVASSIVAGLLRFVVAAWLFARSLRRRRDVQDARLLARFEWVRQRTQLPSILLRESAQLSVPVVLGRREICIPQGVLSRLSDEELAAIFAHELAHLERGDGLWFPLFGLVQAAFWMQPCNLLVAAKFRASAELACDDRAVELTQAPVGLARALTRVAELSLLARRRPWVPALFVARAHLQRVQRLLERRATNVDGRCSSLGVPVGCLLTLALLSPTLHVERAPKSSRQRQSVEPAGAELEAASNFADQMHAFVLAEQRLSAELARLQGAVTAPSDQAKLLELEQDLRHTRALQAFTQARYEQGHAHSLLREPPTQHRPASAP